MTNEITITFPAIPTQAIAEQYAYAGDLACVTGYSLYTEAGDGLNGTTWTDRDEMLYAVKTKYGNCDFGIAEGTILNSDEELVATFGEV